LEEVLSDYTTTEIKDSKIIDVTIDRLAWIKKSCLSSAEEKLIKRRCIFVPKKDRFNTDPKPIQLWEEKVDLGIKYLGVPKGYYRDLVDGAHSSTSFNVIDNRSKAMANPNIKFIEGFSLRDYQYPAVRNCLDSLKSSNETILEAATGSGKTIMSQYVRQKLGVRAVLVFHKSKLIKTWINSIKKFEPNAKIGIIGEIKEIDSFGNEKKKKHFEFEDCDYVLCLYQTMVSEGFTKKLEKRGYTRQQFFNYFGMLILDEVNRGGSEQFSTVLKMFNTYYTLAVTGTLRRSDGNIGIINMYCGKTCYKLEMLASEEPEVFFVRTGFGFNIERYPNSSKIAQMTYSSKILPKIESRNKIIVSRIIQALKKERQIIIFAHTHNLLNEVARIAKLNIENEKLPYKVGKYTGKASAQEIQFSEREADVIFATHKDANDGIDIPRLDAVFFIDPSGDCTQAIGRVLRKYDEKDAEKDGRKPKKKPIVIYFTDNTPQSQDMVYAFKKIVLDKTGWKNNFMSLREHHMAKARVFNDFRNSNQKPKVIIKKRGQSE